MTFIGTIMQLFNTLVSRVVIFVREHNEMPCYFLLNLQYDCSHHTAELQGSI